MKQIKMDIKTFTDYRAFLKLYAYEAKERNSAWTYGVWANQLELKDTSSLTKILNGQRHPGEEISSKFCQFFKFTMKDRAYFHDLVALYKNKDNPRLCLALMEKMGKKFPNSDMAIIDTRSFEFFSQWYVMPLRELVRLPWFVEDHQWIADQFKSKVTALEIKKGLELLTSLGLIGRDEKGRLEIQHGRVTSTQDVKSDGLRIYHESMLDKAKEALSTQDVLMREFIGCCMNINPTNVPMLKELIREFKEKVEELVEENNGQQMYQLQIQLFALTDMYKEVSHD